MNADILKKDLKRLETDLKNYLSERADLNFAMSGIRAKIKKKKEHIRSVEAMTKEQQGELLDLLKDLGLARLKKLAKEDLKGVDLIAKIKIGNKQ